MGNFLLLLGVAALVHAIPLENTELQSRELNGVGLTPALGWNNWNSGLGKYHR